MSLPKQEHDSIAERLAEIRAEHDTIPEAPSREQGLGVAEQLDRETTDLLRKLADGGTAMTEPESSRNNLPCPQCTSTELEFMGLEDKTRATETLGTTEPDTKMTAANYKWKCRNCNHQFEVTIHN